MARKGLRRTYGTEIPITAADSCNHTLLHDSDQLKAAFPASHRGHQKWRDGSCFRFSFGGLRRGLNPKESPNRKAIVVVVFMYFVDVVKSTSFLVLVKFGGFCGQR